MAKLSAHGTELLRIRREYTVKMKPDAPIFDRDTQYREVRSYRSRLNTVLIPIALMIHVI